MKQRTSWEIWTIWAEIDSWQISYRSRTGDDVMRGTEIGTLEHMVRQDKWGITAERRKDQSGSVIFMKFGKQSPGWHFVIV
jgi:hypothetical protein